MNQVSEVRSGRNPWLLAFCVLLVAFLAIPDPGSSIATRHDREAEQYLSLGEQFPAVGKVGLKGGDGTLIAPQWVMTAGHVARGMTRRTKGDFKVYFNGDQDVYAVTQVIVHPEFAAMGAHDIALLKLDRPVEGIAPAALYPANDELKKQIVIVGHGDSKQGTGGDWVRGGQRQAATNEVDEISDFYIMFDFDAPPEGTDLEGTAGPGDSGGPAFIMVDGQPKVAGVSSLGAPGENGPGTYGAMEHYVRVSAYKDWLAKTMQAPPAEKFVNIEDDPKKADKRGGPVIRKGGRVVRGGPGSGPRPGVRIGATDRVDEIGLIFANRNGKMQMVGKVDPWVPAQLNALNLRPPATVHSVNGVEVSSTEEFRKVFDAIGKGEELALVFHHNGETKQATLKKPKKKR